MHQYIQHVLGLGSVETFNSYSESKRALSVQVSVRRMYRLTPNARISFSIINASVAEEEKTACLVLALELGISYVKWGFTLQAHRSQVQRLDSKENVSVLDHLLNITE